MRHSLRYPTQPLKWQQFGEGEAAEVEAAAVVVIAVQGAPPPTVPDRVPHPNTRVPNTLTCPRGSGVGVICTSAGVVRLIFVQNRLHVLGRIFFHPSQPRTNEDPASSARIIK